MCGRFTLKASSEEVASTFGIDLATFRLEARYNIAPGQWLLLVRPERGGSHGPALAQWGLVPSWAKEPDRGPRPINARAEGLAERPTFRGALRHGRVLVPASGWYEWKGRQPHYFQGADGGLLAFAGLASTWAGPDGELDTCAVVTTPANALAAPIHDRMPALLPQEAWAAWLDPATPVAEALSLLVPAPEGSLQVHPVGPRVGRVGEDGPDLIAPLVIPKGLFD